MIGNVVAHIVVMVVGALLLVIGAIVGSTDKGEKKLNLHRGLGVTGILLFLLGEVGLIAAGKLRPNLPHFYLGIITVIFFILAAIGGFVYTKADSSKKQGLRKSHKTDVAIAFLLVLFTVIFGALGIKTLTKY
jgi:lysylphosphatidylglycerol synthetase-like protein (DUF2156 family)